jgi:hypothetical protein
MPGDIRTLFVPWGDLKPDARQFGGDGLAQSKNAVPVHGTYVIPPLWVEKTGALPARPLGLHVHSSGETVLRTYYGDATALYDCDMLNLIGALFTVTVKTRAAGGPYGAAVTGGNVGWQGASFGDAVIMTDYVDDPQLLTAPTVANFVKLAQSGAGNPGMDPRARFVFPVKGNLFLANLNLPAALLNPDGTTDLAAGAHPTTVCWSQTENVRQFGSFKATPQLTGCGYQPLNYDFGHLSGGIGGSYAMLAFQQGWARCDGPPYTFRPLTAGHGCRQPNSIIRYGDDVYFWGAQGPMAFRGGDGQPVAIGRGRIVRTLIDNRTLFNFAYSQIGVPSAVDVSATRDMANTLIAWSFTSNSRVISGGYAQTNDLAIVYNVEEDRFGFIENRGTTFNTNSGVQFMSCGPDLGYGYALLGLEWSPLRDTVGSLIYSNAGAAAYRLCVPKYDSTVNVTSLWQRCFQQLDPDMTTRVRRVRAVFSRGQDASAATVTVSVASKNKPYETAVAANFTTLDPHGWVTTPTTGLADFHQIQVSILAADMNSVMESEGFEVEYETGGRYSA